MYSNVIIEIESLRLYARHGVLAQERVVGNTFEISVWLEYPACRAVDDDVLSGTLDYAEAVEVIKTEMEQPSALLEHVCGRIRDALMRRWPAIAAGSVKLTKLSPPIAAQLRGVSVTLRW